MPAGRKNGTIRRRAAPHGLRLLAECRVSTHRPTLLPGRGVVVAHDWFGRTPDEEPVNAVVQRLAIDA